ncbi:hypothetical protein K5549_016847, partial [Capra hircus]
GREAKPHLCAPPARMFLMNAPPVLALRSAWEAFGPPGSCRFPRCFSEPREGSSRAAASAQVQMAISRLQGDKAALGMSGEHARPGSQRAERGRGALPAASPAFAACGLAVGLDPKQEEEEASSLGPLVPDSDSDDSVDRDIEEAIQEYLRAKSGAAPPPASGDAARRCRPEPPLSGAPATPRPPNPAAGPSPVRGSASPLSVSSDDSFEQSIQAEIEQFLSEKRLHETQKGAGKEFVFRKLPRSAKASALPRGLRCKVATEPAAAATVGPPAEAAPGKGGVLRGAGCTRKGRRPRSTAPVPEEPDSSSDDGIEEAIRLYQREQRRGPWPEAHSKTPGKKKPAAPKATDLGPGSPDPEHPPRPPRERSVAAESLGLDGSPRRADTSAELMCAEAILDISKAILPAPVDGGERPAPTSPLRQGPDGDSSAVDSDDSIEREIRTFLALKAQSGGPLPHTETCARPAHSPPPPSLSAPAPDTPDPSPGCRRRRSRTPCTPRRPRDTAETQDAQDAERGQGRVQPGQGRAPEAPRRESESHSQPLPFKTGGPGGELGAPDPLGAAPPGPGQTAEGRRGDRQASSEEKSSSLDSDEDLDTAIKDLLRSKRRLRKRCRDPRAGCKKRVRFSTTETQFLDKLGGFQKDWRDRSPHLLKSCLSKSKRDSRESPGRPLHVPCRETARAKVDGSGPEDTPSGPSAPWTRGRAAPGGPFSRESAAHEPPGATESPSSLSDESSSVDSDDSIELEIRKFLAEKAKESLSGSEIAGGGPAALGTLTGARPELPGSAQPRTCTRSQRVRGAPLLGAEGPQGPGTALAPGGGSSLHPEQPCAPATLARCELAPPRSTSGPAPAKGAPAPRRNICAPRDPGPRGPDRVTGEGTFGQLPSRAEAGARAEGRGSLARTPGSQRDGAPRAGLTLPWPDLTPQSQLQSTWVLGPEGRDMAAWRGGLGGQKEKGPGGQARGSPSLATDPRRGLPFAGFSPLLSTQLFHFGKSVPWGAKQTGLFSPGLGLPLQGPSFSAFREAQATCGPVFGSPRLLVKESSRWPCRKPRAGLGLSDRRGSGPEEGVLDLRFGRRGLDRDEEEPEALGSDASELSDTSVEEGSGPAAQGPVLQL